MFAFCTIIALPRLGVLETLGPVNDDECRLGGDTNQPTQKASTYG
jgi:hypothetical protein